MKPLDRNQLQKIFKKVKHFRLPKNFDDLDWPTLKYLGWIDETDRVVYTVYEYNGKHEGIRWEMNRMVHKPLFLGICDLCGHHRELGETLSIYAHTRTVPKGVEYRSRGFYICADFMLCNQEMKHEEGIKKIYSTILE